MPKRLSSSSTGAMERNDSSSAIASLAMYGRADDEYSDKSDVSDDENSHLEKRTSSTVDNISDEETENVSRPSSRPVLEEEYHSGSSVADKEPVKKALKRKPGLVSYDKDDMDDSDEEDRSDEEFEEEEENEENTADPSRVFNSSLNPEQASALSRSVRNKSVEEIEIPPEPAAKCPRHLQEKIARLYEKMKSSGLDMVSSIERRKDFRNPSICEKLIEYCGIDEKGTNYPPDVFDPHKWGKESFYDSLDKAQKLEMEKREKERKERTKIEFVVGTKKSGGSEGPSDEKKRKSKWDAQPSLVAGLPGVVSLTSSATGTKSTVIPALGSITKKSSK